MKFLEMKFPYKGLSFLCVLCASVVNCFSLDREAFSFTSYDLNVQVEPEQHRLGVRGKLTLRNDRPTSQKIAVLQISSSLAWRSIKAADKPLQFLSQPYTSDIDHTGALSEAIVTLPQPVSPQATIELEIAYEGAILLDATRLTRIGTPEEAARSADWDRIDSNFTAVRGAGYVAWYPIATETANLSDDDLSDVLGRWKTRESESHMSLLFESTRKSTILFSGTPDMFAVVPDGGMVKFAAFSVIRTGMNVPTFVLADYNKIDVNALCNINFWPTKDVSAAAYADALGSLDPLSRAPGPKRLQVAELPDSGAAPFVSENLLLTPLGPITEEDRLTLVYGIARQRVPSPRPWINDGLAHFAQVQDIEHQHGRKAALDYLNAHRTLFIEFEKQAASIEASVSTEPGNPAANRSLVNTTDDLYLRSKAMWVWWMLHDMVGDTSLNLALITYNVSEDKEPSYMPRLIAAHTQRDLEWFFDDWVYRDRGLPDFKVESAFSRKTISGSFMLTITLDNLGTAGAEVPVIVKFSGGEIMRRLEVRAKNKAVVRVEVPATPQEIVVNDGSVPESNMANNNFKIAEEAK